jgi:hypothetical protein
MAQNGPRFGLILTLAKVPIVVKAVIRPSDQIVINMSPCPTCGPSASAEPTWCTASFAILDSGPTIVPPNEDRHHDSIRSCTNSG